MAAAGMVRSTAQDLQYRITVNEVLYILIRKVSRPEWHSLGPRPAAPHRPTVESYQWAGEGGVLADIGCSLSMWSIVPVREACT